MLRFLLTISSIFCAAVAAAQNASAPLVLSTSRLNDIALRWAAPEELPHALALELEQTFQALDQGKTELAVTHWQEFLHDRAAMDVNFDAGIYVDHLLHRVAVTRNASVNAADRRLRFYDTQEAAALEHLTTVDKQISIYGGEDNPQVPLREPDLPDYAEGVEPVTLPPAKTVGVPELVASMKHWRARTPKFSEAREKACADFVAAVAADVALGEELHRFDGALRGEIKTLRGSMP